MIQLFYVFVILLMLINVWIHVPGVTIIIINDCVCCFLCNFMINDMKKLQLLYKTVKHLMATTTNPNIT